MENNLEYNTDRENLIIPEYGRHVQKMIDYAISKPTKEERNKLAQAIISVMGNLQPHLRDVPDFQHKLWDQLFIMSKFELDVDSPFGKPSSEVLSAKPAPLNYPQNYPKYRFYGNNIKTMIDVACTWEEGEMKSALVYTIANHMKKCFLSWNKDTVEDSVIIKHLLELSNGKLDLTNSKEVLTESSSLLKGSTRRYQKKPYQKKQNTNNRYKKRH